LLNIYACKVLIEFLPRKNTFPLESSINFLIIFHASREQRASERREKMCISIVVIFQHHRREISDGSEHDEDQVGNVISNIACMQQFNLFSS
jgi:hypothetical protein